MPRAKTSKTLPHKMRGRKGPPIVLIHGFGGEKEGWGALYSVLSRWRRTIAVDLPGHGDAVDWKGPAPDAKTCAGAVTSTIEALDAAPAVLVGHSLGGAVAAIIGLTRPDLVEKLVLIAPGGFGKEMNARLVHRYAAAHDEATLSVVLEQFFSPSADLPDALAGLIAARRTAEDIAMQTEIAKAITRGAGQRTLPLDQLAEAPFATTLVWGFDDQVLPVGQAVDAPAVFARHLLPGVGHMPHLEAPETVLRIIAQALGNVPLSKV